MGKIIFDIIMITLPIITFILLTANIIYSERVDENPTTSLGNNGNSISSNCYNKELFRNLKIILDKTYHL